MHRKAGYTIGRSTYQQIKLMGGGNGYTKGTAIKCNASTLKPGDLIYYNNNSHVAMYIGKGMIVHASNSKAYPDGGIKVSNYLYGNVYKAVRFWS
jgi:cell wall-associated NlpC family hydrolase